MKSFVRLLICILVVSSPAQSWAAPMLCQSDTGTDTAALEHGHGSSHEHRAGTHQDSAGHDDASTHDQSSSECTSDCECSHCVVTVALSDSELASVGAYRGERAVIPDSNLGPYLDSIFRPPISS